jgi:fructoselysine 6-kinase
MKKAACFSVAAMDYFPQQDEYYAGGNALNQSIRFRSLGWESAFLGALGTDEAGDRIKALLLRTGVDISGMRRLPGRTASNRIVNDKDGERFGVDGAWDNGVYANYCLSEVDWTRIADFPLWSTHGNGINYPGALRSKKPRNFLAVDFLHFDTYELLEQGLDAVDIAYFGGVPGQLPDLIALSRRFSGIIVLTLGASGSVAIRDGETIFEPALPLQKVVDTTGCGDAFQAGFTAEYLSSRNIHSALRQGAELGRVAAGHYGGVMWE